MMIQRLGIQKIIWLSVLGLLLPGCGTSPASPATPTIGATDTPAATATLESTPTRTFTITPDYTPTPTLGPLTMTDLYLFRNGILNVNPPATVNISAECPWSPCTVSYVYSLQKTTKGNTYGYRILPDYLRVTFNLRIFFSQGMSKTLLAEWKGTDASQAVTVGTPFEGNFGDKIILELDLPGRSSIPLNAPWDDNYSYISIGYQENARIPTATPTATSLPTPLTGKQIQVVYVAGGAPVPGREIWLAYYDANSGSWVIAGVVTDDSGTAIFRVPEGPAGESAVFTVAASQEDLAHQIAGIQSGKQTGFRIPPGSGEAGATLQLDDQGYVNILEGSLQMWNP